MERKLTTLLLAGLLVGTANAQGGPMGYWMTAGNQQTIVRYDSGITNLFATSGGQDYPIAVSGDVRTAGSGQFANDHGGQYGLNGVWTGVDYADLAFDPAFNVLGYDGTTNGSKNFFMNFGNLGGVWAANRDWTNPQMLFALGGFGNRLGITYDQQSNTLWTSHWDSGMVEEYDMAGNLLTSWDSGLGGSLTCLAMDYSDNSIWMGRQSAPGFFYNYDQAGNRIGSFFDASISTLNTLGGEFNVVPEPVSLLALGASLAAIARKRRR